MPFLCQRSRPKAQKDPTALNSPIAMITLGLNANFRSMKDESLRALVAADKLRNVQDLVEKTPQTAL